MRHGHKTSKGKFNGHKAQILMEESTEIITNVAVTPGNEADGDYYGTTTNGRQKTKRIQQVRLHH